VSRASLTAALLAIALTILAAVGTPVTAPASSEVLYVLDVSRSHGPSPGLLLERLRQQHQAGPHARASFRVVAAGRVASSGQDALPPDIQEGSNVDLGLAVASRIRDGATRIVVFSDGRFDPAPVSRHVDALAAEGVSVSFAGPLAQPALDMRLVPRGEARLEGGRARVRAAIAGTNREPRAVSLAVAGGTAKSAATIVVAPGATEEWEALVPVAPDAAWLTVRIALEEGPDAAPANDELVVPIARDRPRAVVAGRRAGLARALEAAGFVVATLGTLADVGPAQLEAADLLVVVDEPVTGVPEERIRALEEAVTGGGLGLWVVGGPRAFGGGGYAGSRLDDLLPLSSRTAGRKQVTVVLDTSGSMEKDDRLGRAVDVVVALAGELGPEDSIQVLPFAEAPGVPILRSAEAGAAFLATAVPGLRTIVPRGGTRLLPALDAALALERRPDAGLLLVLISDLRDETVSEQDLAARKRVMAEAKIGSVVALLDPAPETEARARAVATNDVITVAEYGARIRAQVRGQEAIVAAEADSVLPGGKPGPRILWRNPVRAGKDALVALETRDREPLMASAPRGVGRTAAWAAWPADESAAAALMGEWAARIARPAGWRKIAVRREGGSLVLTMPPGSVSAGAWSVSADDGPAAPLAERRPGVFEVADPGDARALRVTNDGSLVAVVPVPPAGDPEYAWPPASWPAGAERAPASPQRGRAAWAALAALAWGAALLRRQRRPA
jgi:hypothetical protein